MAGIKEVAKHAGVAVGTVSRVINNHSTVNPEIKERVLQAIEELNYVPNEVARSFKLKTTKNIAFLVPSIWNPFFSELAFYVEDELDRQGYKLLLCNSGGKPEKEQYYIEMLHQNKVAGILGITYNEHSDEINKDIPFVSIDRKFSNDVQCVTSDNFEGGRIAAKKLIEGGCKQLAFIGEHTTIESEVSKRKEGFIFEARKSGLEPVVFEKTKDFKDRHDFVCEFSKKFVQVDGVFANGDLLAAEYIHVARKLERKIPQELKVIGYDGIQNTDLFHPILSTIRQPVKEIAIKSVELLLKKIKGEEMTEKTVIIPVHYKKGETT